MFSKAELLSAINELEGSPATYQNAEKLAVFYLLYDHLFVDKEPLSRFETVEEVTIDRYDGSEFMQAISGKKAAQIWAVMDELMLTIQALQPKLYQATIDRIMQE